MDIISSVFSIVIITLVISGRCMAAGEGSYVDTGEVDRHRRLKMTGQDDLFAIKQSGRRGTGLTTNSNFIITVNAGQPTTVSPENLSFASTRIPSRNIVYIVTKPLDFGQGYLLLIDQPNQQVQRFTQEDVNSQKLVYLPPRAEEVSSEQLFIIDLAVVRSPGNHLLLPHVTFKIRLLPLKQNDVKFTILNPIIDVKKMKTTDIAKQYFEISGTDNYSPELKYVIIEMPQNGALFLQCKNKPSLNLDGGIEFSLWESEECVLQYENYVDDGSNEDMFEVLATDGHFEIENHFQLNIITIDGGSKINNKRKEDSSRGSIDYILQFASNQVISVDENSTSVRIPVQRWGDLSSESQVQCFTTEQTAKAGKDYVERPRNSIQSLLIFPPGIVLVDCEVFVIDDMVYEKEEELLVNLGNLYGSPRAVLGDNRSITLKIMDLEDKPMVCFEKIEISVPEPMSLNSGDDTSTITVNVIRVGDLSKEARVRVSTSDHTAVGIIDYEPVSQLLVFSPGTKILPVQVRVRHRLTRTQTQVFSLILSPKELSGAELCEKASLTIKLNPGVHSALMKVLPVKPVVVSLLEYDTMQNNQYSKPSPGYPLVCVSSCDSKHPQYRTTKVICESSAIDDSNIAYSWEIALPGINRRLHPTFRALRDSTIFAHSNNKVLDPLFFSKQSNIRCVTTPFSRSINGRKVMGLPLRSTPMNIGSEKESFCPLSTNGRSSNLYFRENSFVAILKYVEADDPDVKHKNTIHVHIEIPHSDGMVPLVSTLPLSNPRLLLLDRRHSGQHMCSNLHSDSAFLQVDDSSSFQWDVGFRHPYQFSASLRGEDTVQLYRHLNLNTCTWKFDAWFQMSQLVDSCGGKITSEYQVADAGESFVTVIIPLHVTYMTARAPAGWTAIEHRTEMEVSFRYSSMLMQGGVNTEHLQHESKTQVQTTKLFVDEDGRLVINLETTAPFQGCFVNSHENLPEVRSELIPPVGLHTDFILDLLWTQNTWDGPDQLWQATSVYSLQDYSGEYTLKLVPCIVQDIQNHDRDDEMICSPQEPMEFTLQILFRQSSRPSPLVYNLNTQFVLTNDQNTFLASPAASENIKGYSGVFSPGEDVYGRVSWHESQHLNSAYTLSIQRVYLCAGADGYIPLLDDTHYGCLQTSPKIRHSFLLLDRANLYSQDKQYNEIPLEAYFSSDLPEYDQLQSYPGVDGFILRVDSLYGINSGYTWYLQVFYTIGASNSGRSKRSLSTDVSVNSQFQNGSDMKVLYLKKLWSAHLQAEAKEKGSVIIIITWALSFTSSGVIVIVVGFWIRSKWKKKVFQPKCTMKRSDHVPLNSLVHVRRNYKTSPRNEHRIPAVTVWNDIRGTVTEV